MMEFSVDSLSTAGLALHILCSVLIFIAWCLTIATYTTDGSITGTATSLYFVLCFLSIPAILYLTLTLRFTRSRKWANAYAFVALDFVLSLLWFCIFIALAVFNTGSKCGSDKGCALSKTLVGFGFFLFAFFAVCTAISVKGLLYFRSTGVIPGVERGGKLEDRYDPDRDAFVTGGEDEYAPVQLKEDDPLDAGIISSGRQGLHHQVSDTSLQYGVDPLSTHQNSTAYEGHDQMRYQGDGLGGLLNEEHGVVGGHRHTGGSFMTPDDVGAVTSNYRPAYVASEAGYGEEPLHSPNGNLQFPAGNYR